MSCGASDSRNGAWVSSTTTINDYGWREGAVIASSSFNRTGAAPLTSTTSYTYGVAGALEKVKIVDGREREVKFVNDLGGQALRRDEADGLTSGDPHEVWYRFAGKQMGYAGNNGTLETDYAGSIASRQQVAGNGPFRGGQVGIASHSDFDNALSPITSYSQGGAGGSYQVRGGETLGSIAANLWGDASLWYKLAEANGMGAAGALAEGQRLIVPAGVMRSTHNAATFRPYDPGDILGELGPVSPAAQQSATAARNNRCGGFGAVLLVAVAVAVSIATSGAIIAAAKGVSLAAGIGSLLGTAAGAGVTVGTGLGAAAGAVGGAVGSIVSQGVGVATGLQDRFSWKGVALAGLSGGVGGGLGARFPGGGVLAAAARGAAGSAIAQGVAVATGLQGKFDWAGVAAAGIGSAAAAMAGGATRSLGRFASSLAANTAGGIANAAGRSVMEGTSFGDNVMRALPDAIGSTIGNMVGNAFRGGSAVITVNEGALARAGQSAFSLDTPFTISEVVSYVGLYRSPVAEAAALQASLAAAASAAGTDGGDIVVTAPARRLSASQARALAGQQASRAAREALQTGASASSKDDPNREAMPVEIVNWAYHRNDLNQRYADYMAAWDASGGIYDPYDHLRALDSFAENYRLIDGLEAAAAPALARADRDLWDLTTVGLNAALPTAIYRVAVNGEANLENGIVIVASVLGPVAGVSGRLLSRTGRAAESISTSGSQLRAIVAGAADLSPRQASVLGQLEGFGNRAVIPKRGFGQNDLAALSAATGDEFAMFTTGGRRLLIRGDSTGVPIGLADGSAQSLASQGWRFSSHVHPDGSLLSSAGDRAVLSVFGNSRSAVLSPTGGRGLFNANGDMVGPGWLPGGR